MNELHHSAITLAIQLCGSVEKAIELMEMRNKREIKAEYWQGIADAMAEQWG